MWILLLLALLVPSSAFGLGSIAATRNGNFFPSLSHSHADWAEADKFAIEGCEGARGAQTFPGSECQVIARFSGTCAGYFYDEDQHRREILRGISFGRGTVFRMPSPPSSQAAFTCDELPIAELTLIAREK